MDRRPRLSSAQWEQLVGFFEENPQVARGYTRSTQGRQQALRMWEQLALLLNSSGEGVTKDAKSWSKFWNDYKCKLRKKVQEITANMQGTGGGPALEEVLSNIEIRLMAVLGENFGRQLEGVAVDPFAPRNQAPSQSEEVVEMVLLDDPHNPPTLGPGLEVVSVGEEVTLACGGVEEPHTVQPPADQQPTDQPSSSAQRGPSASRGPVRPRRHRQRNRPQTALDEAQNILANIEAKRVKAEHLNATSLAEMVKLLARKISNDERTIAVQEEMGRQVASAINNLAESVKALSERRHEPARDA